MHTIWSWLAGSVVALHYGYLGYLISGGFLAWRWPKSIVGHVAAALWAVLIVVTRVPCPLTSLQNNLRQRAGQQPLSGSFVEVYVRGTLFPGDRIGLAQVVVAMIVVTSWLGFVYVARPDLQRSRHPGH